MLNQWSNTSNVLKRHYSRVWSKLFWISLPEAETQVINVELRRDIWLNFALVTAQSCAIYMEMYRDSVIVLLHNAKMQAASHCCLYKFSPNIHPLKPNLSLTDQYSELSKYSEQSLISFSVFEIWKLLW